MIIHLSTNELIEILETIKHQQRQRPRRRVTIGPKGGVSITFKVPTRNNGNGNGNGNGRGNGNWLKPDR
jgi:hypothetical protein